MRKIVLAFVVGLLALSVTACGELNQSASEKASHEVNKKARGRAPYLPKHDVEFNNFNNAQKLYDTPSTIIWCTSSWSTPSSPIFTVPVAGKLTSSSVSFFRSQEEDWGLLVEKRSVDGMFHGSPPPYRYGFTPGGQYVDFSNMPTFCTTALTKFQRQNTKVALEVDPRDKAADAAAQDALRRGDKQAAQKILERSLHG